MGHAKTAEDRTTTQPVGLAAGVLDVMEVPESFDEVFGTEYPRLARALAVAEDAANAEDAVQEAFILAEHRWSSVSELEDPVGWVRRVAVNRLSNSRRNRRRRTEILATLRPPDPAWLDPVDLDLQAAVRALPPSQRLALCLHHLAGYTVREIASMLGVAEGTVKSNLHDARAALRRRLEVTDDVS